MKSVPRIDAHHHLWRYTPEEYGWIDEPMAELRRDFLPGDLKLELDAAGIDGAVAVQARQTLEETRWLLDIAEQHDDLCGVVGWAPIAAKDFPACMEEFSGRQKLKGLRHVIQAEPDDYILRDDFNAGIRALQGTGLVYDILILERHLPQTIQFVDRHPNQIFVLDHVAKPLIASGLIEPWAGLVRELAKREHVYCKVSGMVTEADWIYRPPGFSDVGLHPYLDVVLEAFGSKRLLAGSDWPVCLVATDYATWFKTLERYFSSLSTEERAIIFGGTAIDVYHLAA